MEGTSISYFSPALIAINSIHECIRELVKMLSIIFQRGNRPSLGVTLDKEQQEILCIKSNVVLRLEMLFKGTVEGGQNSLPTSHLPPSEMEGKPSPYFPTVETASGIISKCIEELLQMQPLMHQIDESLSRSVSQEKVIHIKSSVVSQLEVLFKTTKEADEEALDDEVDKEEEEALDDDEVFVQGNESLGQQKLEGFKWSSLDAMKDTKGRYLCLSNGYEVWCLDLKQSSCNTEPGPLPLISTLNLLGGELPTSVGLFNLGSDVYLIGGKKLPASLKKWDLRRVRSMGNCVCKPEGLYRYRALCYTRGAEGSSRLSYRLSLDADKDGALSPSKCNIEPLNNPKFWPIVENIDGKLHVMDFRPFYLMCDSDDFIFSHEVCEVGSSNGSWKDIPTGGAIDGIFNHVVVGDRIYAKSYGGRKGEYILEFDSQTEEWKRLPVGKLVTRFFMVETVGEVMSFGTGRCAGEFPFPFPHEGERVFVLFAIVDGEYDYRGKFYAALAVAYLVTLTGQVICYQHVRDFFSKEERLQPYGMIAATVIHVDKDQGTMCSVVSAFVRGKNQVGWREKREHLFINTFSVEMLTCAAPKVRDLLVKKASGAEDWPPVKLEFVRIAVKDRFVYETDVVTYKDGYERCLGWRACFVTPSRSSCIESQLSSLEPDE